MTLFILLAIVQKMEEENKVNGFLVNEKYPKELASYRQKVRDCESVAAKAIMSQAEIGEIKAKLAAVNGENEKLMQKRDSNRDLSDDKLIMFRQQASIVARKRDQCAENLEQVWKIRGFIIGFGFSVFWGV
jgi:intraflagellar transport protein 81